MPDRALLIVPPTGVYIREDRCQTPIKKLSTVAPRPPIDLLYLASCLRKEGVGCKVRDFPVEGEGWRSLEEELKEFNPSLLFISCTTPTLKEDLQATSLAKKINPSTLTIGKGAHFFVRDRETLNQFPSLDMVIRGEQEEVVGELARGVLWEEIRGITFRRGEKIIRTPERDPIEDLDSLPFPARDLINNSLYVRPDTGEPQTTLVATRGCPYPCIFCLAGKVSGRRVRVRSPENILEEIKECRERFGIRNFLFRGDTFTYNREWAKSLCKAIIAEFPEISWCCNSRVDTLDRELVKMMKRAGCWLVALGVESGSDLSLKKMHKGQRVEDARRAVRLLKEEGIKVSCYFILGLPWEGEEEIKLSIKLAQELRADFTEFFFAYPFPGTPLYQEIERLGLTHQDFHPECAYNLPTFPTLKLTRGKLIWWRRKALRKVYLRASYILSMMKKAGSLKILFNYFRYGLRELWG